MISQGSSELNISFCIDETEVEKAVKAVHKAFGLERQMAEATKSG